MKAFDSLISQEQQPFSVEGKIDGLELFWVRASYSFDLKRINKGPRRWMEASLLRSSPKVCIPREDRPPVIRENVRREWADYSSILELGTFKFSTDKMLELVFPAC